VKATLTAILAALLAGPALAAPAGPAGPPGPPVAKGSGEVRVYLLRTVRAEGEELKLGTLAVVLADGAELEARARNVALGRTPWPKEKLVIDRVTILSRLAACGIDRDSVRFSGAPNVTVVRSEQTVAADEIVSAAEKFLLTARPAPGGGVYQVVRKPQEIVVTDGGKTELACKLQDVPGTNQVRVCVAVQRGDKQLAMREVVYKLMYRIRKAVVTQVIPAGSPLTQENVEVQTEYSEQPAQGDWKAPYGLLAARRMAVGTVLLPNMAAEKRPDILVHRNEMVRLRIEGPGFKITGMGQAIDEGRPGDTIKVRNVDSKQVITGLIAFDGSVEPMLGK
jgi:flagella basal body P-ring formation protein FlgA